MKELIIQKLSEIEKENDVTILHAIESGSRAWGFASPDSDYDIRFIYKSELDHYLSLNNERDIIEFTTKEDFDGSGWDLKKAFTLLSKSNTPILEWIHAPIVYKTNNSFIEELKNLSIEYFNPIACFYHYSSTAKNFLDSCLDDKFKLKSYFYLLRNLLSAKWIIDFGTFPPVIFDELLVLVDVEIKNKIKALIQLKSEKKESYLHDKNEVLNQFVLNIMKYNQANSDKLKSNKTDNKSLNLLFKKIIKS